MKKQEYDIVTITRLHLANASVLPEMEERIIQDTIRKQKELYNDIVNRYQLYNADGSKNKNHMLTWPQLAEITDYVAHHTASDEQFALHLWLLFGVSMHQPLTEFIDPGNVGLPHQYHNTLDYQEQFHHYIGGVTGNQIYHSHLLNWPIVAELSETPSLAKSPSKMDQGDINLFYASQSHRNDFVLGSLFTGKGRFSVAPNIRKLLKE